METWKVEVTNKDTGEPTGLQPEQMNERIHELNVVDASDGNAYVALVFGDIDDKSAAIKRANILAASQDMLAALEDAVSTQPDDSPIKWVIWARAAIAKARGE